jgi:hypothetical protein
VTRRGLGWLVALPLVLVGSQIAHGTAYWWAYPNASLRASVLDRSGHSYLAYAPAVLALAAAVELLALGVTAFDATHRRPSRALPAWLFAVLPLLAYTLQEHLERLLHSGSFPWWTALDPTFWRGAVLQVPVGLAAWLVARLLLRTAAAVGRRLGAAPRRPLLRPRARVHVPSAAAVPRVGPIAGSAAGRAPPAGVTA